MVLDHFGSPVAIGEYEGRKEGIFAVWEADIAAIAECPNVVAKIGGLAMPPNWARRTYRVRLALGLGTKAASLKRKSCGVNSTTSE